LFNVYVYGTIGMIEYMDKVDNVLPYILRSWAMWQSAQKGSRQDLTNDDNIVECTSLTNKIVTIVTVSQNKEV